MTVAATHMPKQAPVTPANVVDTMACPECGRLAEVVDRFVLASTDGPIEHTRLRCDAGRHHLTIIYANPANANRISTSATGSRSELHPTASGNTHVNILMNECTHFGWLRSTEGSV